MPGLLVKSKDIICFTTVLLTGAFLRFFRLNTQGLFLDETVSWATARMPIAQMVDLSFRDGHPLLYYLLLKAFLAIIPDTEVGLRALSALSSVAAPRSGDSGRTINHLGPDDGRRCLVF